MIRLAIILVIFVPILLYGQGDLSIKANDQLKPTILPKSSWSDTTLGWSTSFQYHQKKSISKYYQCMGASHLYEYVVTENKNGILQLDRTIYYDSIGNCYSNVDSLRNKVSELRKLLDYSVIYDSLFNVVQIVYRSPIVLNSQQMLLEAHENYLWEEMQYGKWLIQVRASILSGVELPIQNFSLSPIAQNYNDSILNLIQLDGLLARKRNDSLEQVFISNHKIEIDSCEGYYEGGQISAVRNCIDCYHALYIKYKCIQSDGSRLRELNSELQKLREEFDKFIVCADQAYSQKSWDEALYYYQKSLEIDKASQYVLKQIEKIKQLTKPMRH